MQKVKIAVSIFHGWKTRLAVGARTLADSKVPEKYQGKQGEILQILGLLLLKTLVAVCGGKRCVRVINKNVAMQLFFFQSVG